VPSCKISSQSAKRFTRYRDFSIFKMAAVCHHGFLNFWFPIRLGEQRCIIIPNFIKIGLMAAEISHITFFKMAAVRHLDFLN